MYFLMYQLYAKVGNKYGILKLKLLKKYHLDIIVACNMCLVVVTNRSL